MTTTGTKKFGSRVNLGVFPHPTLDLNSGFAYTRGNTRLGQVAPVRDILGSLHWGSPSTRDQRLRGFFGAPPEEMATVEALSGLDRFTWNLQATHRPWSWFTQRLITGVDYASEVSSVLYPRHPDGTGPLLRRPEPRKEGRGRAQDDLHHDRLFGHGYGWPD